MSERTRRQDPLRVEEQDPSSTDSALAPGTGRTYDEKAVADILQRAARLERKKSVAVSELSQAEIEQIAQESGIDPAMVRQAIRDRELGHDEAGSARLAGAPVRKVFERVVDRELTVEEHERLMADLREFVSASGPARFREQLLMPPQVSAVGRTLTFTGYVNRALLEVSIMPRGGKTLIRISTDSSGVAGGFFGGLLGGLGGGLGTNVAIWTGIEAAYALNLPVPVSVGVGATAFLGIMGGAYSMARALFSRNANRLHLSMEKLADRLEATVRVGGPRP